MIRGLLLLLAFAAGIAAAALAVGRMHHLRLAVPDALPIWTIYLAEDAGALSGRAELPARGRWPRTELTWRARAPSLDGWVWDVSLTGDGVDLRGKATLSWFADQAVLTGGSGTLDLGRLRGLPVPVEGILRVDEAVATATDLPSAPVVGATGTGHIPGLRIAGVDAGSGPVSGVLEESGAWQADARLDGGVTALKADIAAEMLQATPILRLYFADGTDLPPALRAMLSASAEPDGAGWRLTLPLAGF